MKSPIRTCAGCRRKRPKAELIRVVRKRDGAPAVDVGASQGRGAYVCFDRSCAERALRSGGLRRVLRLEEPVPADVAEELLRLAGTETRKG